MKPLTVVGFASGSPQSLAAMIRIARDHRLAAIVMPKPRSAMKRLVARALGRPASPLEQLGVPVINMSNVSALHPDLIVVASFPKILPAATLAAARIGVLNFHMSLLPRHRGPDPIFWTYWEDDRDAGVTVHWINDAIDGGDVAAQERMPLMRGMASRELYALLTTRGVDLLSGVLREVASGNLPRVPQDERMATYRSAAEQARARIPFGDWPAERVWHVLSGLGDQFHRLIEHPAVRPLAHGRAIDYKLTQYSAPGRIDALDSGYELHCRDGVVAVERQR